MKCEATMSSCLCGLDPGHDGHHDCYLDRCLGQWTGEYPTDLEVVRWPISGNNPPPVLDYLTSLFE